MAIPNRALIVRQPWIDLILSGKKTWEMRSRPTIVRGRIGLIEQGTGLIVGEANIDDSLDRKYGIFDKNADNFERHRILDRGELFNWPYPWVLSNAIRYETPIKYNHPNGAVIWVDLTKSGVIDAVNKNVDAIFDQDFFQFVTSTE